MSKSKQTMITTDANEAVGSVAYRLNEVIAIYPITPASPMGEWADEWSANKQPNIWGHVPDVVEMQSEGGAAAAVHGALQAGSLCTTFTASQGLLLMIPTMYKIAGELTPFCLHVAARTLATHALSIFGDHSDVMSCRQIGFAMLASGSVQEAHDMACISHAATLESRIPFLHFFDGFRTSHEVSKIELMSDDVLKAMVNPESVLAHRHRALTPDRPVIRGTAQNPDTFFQARESANSYYLACSDIVEQKMAMLNQLTGRAYQLFDYVGHPEATRVLVLMGSGAEVAHETIDYLISKGEKVGLIKVRLYRPFSVPAFFKALPKTVASLAVLDRTKEPGALGEPLRLDILAAFHEAQREGLWSATMPTIVGGRYGLSSKEFNPAMVKSVLDELSQSQPKHVFTVGIKDDVTHLSLNIDSDFQIEPDDVVRAMFYGLGSDGTVGANKNTIKIIGENTDKFVQAYFVYDSKKAGATTISHLRFGNKPIRSSYLISSANFIGCHQFKFLDQFDILGAASPGSTFLLNAPFAPDQVWQHLPATVQKQIYEKKLQFYVIDAYKVAGDVGMGPRINTIMQTCFFAISRVLPQEEAIAHIKYAIEKSYSKRGPEIVEKNIHAVDQTLAHLHKVTVPSEEPQWQAPIPKIPTTAPDFVQRITATIMANQGDLLPVSAFPVDGTWPVGTTKWEKRNIALEIPTWDPKVCIQCNKCAFVCPHSAIRAKVYDPSALKSAPTSFLSTDFKGKEFENMKYTIQVAPEDCTGCNLCVAVCPAKDKANPKHKAIDMVAKDPILAQERENYSFFLDIAHPNRTQVKLDVKGSQFFEPLFEYSGACAGCGETPYVKLMTQLFGDRLLIANATGCSSIYGGNLPTTPYTTNKDGRGPAWANSLFEDNAEFGFGFRLSVDFNQRQAQKLLQSIAKDVGESLAVDILNAAQNTEQDIADQRKRVDALKKKLQNASSSESKYLLPIADYLTRKSVWMLGGDGWAYDIGFGGLDHVISTRRNVNILVLDTEVYSNTGGQASKASPLGASAKFASAGKETPKKDLGMMAMTYGHVYVARVAFGAKDTQTVKAFLEADAYDGPSLIIAYSHCIAHGYDLVFGPEQQKLAVNSGVWPLYRFDPRRSAQGQPPLQLDCSAPKSTAAEYMKNETRFNMSRKMDPKKFEMMMAEAQRMAVQRYRTYEQLSKLHVGDIKDALQKEVEA